MYTFRKGILVVLTLLLLIMPTLPVLADNEEEESSSEESSNSLITEEEIEERNDDANYAERFITGILMSPVNLLVEMFGAKDVSYLVFQRPELESIFSFFNEEEETYVHEADGEDGTTGTRADMILGVFPEEYFSGIALLYDSFHDLMSIPLTMMLAFGGLVLLINNFNAQDRSKFKEYIAGMIFVLVCLRFGHVLWKIIFDINYYIVDLVWNTLSDNGIWTGRFLTVVFGSHLQMTAIESLGVGLLVVVAFFMTFVLNYQYTMRMIILSILIVTFPLVSLSLIFPSRREAMNIWVHEFTSNTFTQTAHALALGMFFYVRDSFGDGLSFWIVCVFLFGLPTVSMLVHKVVGAITGIQTQGKAQDFGAAMGVMSMMHMGRMMQQATKGRTGGSGINPSTAGGAGSGTGGKGATGSSMGNGNALSNSNLSASSVNQQRRGGTVPMSNGRSSNGNGAVFSGGGRAFTAARSIAKGTARIGIPVTGAAVSSMAMGSPAPGLMAGSMLGNSLANADNDDQLNSPGNGYPSSADVDYDKMQNSSAGTESGTDSNEGNSYVGHPAQLPRSYQTYASSTDKLRYGSLHGNDASVNNQGTAQGAQHSVVPTPLLSTGNVSTSQSRQQTTDKAKEGYGNAKTQLKQMNRNTSDPKAYRSAQASAAQARNTNQLAQKLNKPNVNMNTPAKASRQAALATQNYQETQQVLAQTSPDSPQYDQQKEVVQNAKNVMEESVSYANSSYPQLQNPELQESIIKYNEGVTNQDTEAIERHGTAINQAEPTTNPGTQSEGNVSVTEGNVYPSGSNSEVKMEDLEYKPRGRGRL
ncbi:hypothetical protein [Salibacterium aidingense]|uniref:hypothetical protein n=1 Tax=Salibacterium aidingense TaxID=384933 RepID=UPI00041044F0|nr:hypothetical protein [Salibacterium aidingense]